MPEPSGAFESQIADGPEAARLNGATMPYLKFKPARGASGNGNVPASYHTSPESEPINQTSGALTSIAFHVSGAAERAANCVGSHVVKSLMLERLIRPLIVSNAIP